jgi:hypothetical protein
MFASTSANLVDKVPLIVTVRYETSVRFEILAEKSSLVMTSPNPHEVKIIVLAITGNKNLLCLIIKPPFRSLILSKIKDELSI